MKKTIYLLMMVTMLVIACQQKPVTDIKTTDTEAAQKAIAGLLDQFHNSMKSKNASAMMNLLTEDGLFCGTDPTEFWDKKAITDAASKMFNDTAVVINNYPIDKREIRISKDAQSAVTVEQVLMDIISPKIPLRLITHLIKNEDAWKIDFLSWSLVPTNEDTPKISRAVN